MARGFGPTEGTATSDVIVSSYTTNNTDSTWSMWAYRTGDGGGTNNWLWTNAAGSRHFWYDEVGAKLTLAIAFDTAGGFWSMTAPATGGWNHIAWTYNHSSTTNDPILYLNGVSVTVTEDQTPVGTATTTASAFHFGNQSGQTAHFNGRLAEIGHWDRILSAGEIALLGTSGFTPGCIKSGLVGYWPLLGEDSPEPELIAGANGTVTGAIAKTHPTVSRPSIPQSGRFGRILTGRL